MCRSLSGNGPKRSAISPPASQCELPHELDGSAAETFAAQRPILWHLNADTTWLLSLPYPDDAPRPPQRCRFNILIDPWLKGPQSDVAGWFSKQWHSVQSGVETVRELNEVLRRREQFGLLAMGDSLDEHSAEANSSISTSGNYVDAVVCSHEFTDHCHRKTLEEVNPSVPCLATTKAAALIESWEHFQQVTEVPLFERGCNWKSASTSSLPQWLGVARLVGHSDALYLHSAIVIFCKDSRSKHPDGAEAVIYTPHGIHSNDVHCIPVADPPVQTLALIHGLHDVSIPLTKQLNLGGHNGLRCQKILNSQYWIGTHDEVKVAAGIIAPFLRRRAYSLKDVLQAQTKEGRAADQAADNINYVSLKSGQHLLLY